MGARDKKQGQRCLWRFEMGFKVCQHIRGMWEEEWILQGDDGFIFKCAQFLVEHPDSDVVVSV